MKRNVKTTTFWIALMMVVSACVAIVTTITVNHSLDLYTQELQQRDDFIRISKERPSTFPGSYEEALGYVKSSVGDIGFVTAATAADATEASVARVGAVVTSDGWMLMASGSRIDFASGQGLAWIDGVAYHIDTVVEGKLVDLVHLADASGLTPFAFGASDRIESGERIFTFGARDDFFVTTLVNGQQVDTNATVGSLLAPDYEHIAFWELDQSPANTLMVNAAGELVALASAQDDTLVYPIHSLLPWIQASIRGEAYEPARLGVSVAWLDVLFVRSVDRSSGALVKVVHDVDSLFAVDDVITRINGKAIDSYSPIAELLLPYRVGDTVTVTFVRDGQTQEVQVVLQGEDLVY